VTEQREDFFTSRANVYANEKVFLIESSKFENLFLFFFIFFFWFWVSSVVSELSTNTNTNNKKT